MFEHMIELSYVIMYAHKALKPVGEGHYTIGQKHCQVHEIFLIRMDYECPCCGIGN